MTIENPERLWAYRVDTTHRLISVIADSPQKLKDSRAREPTLTLCAPIAEYVLASVVAERLDAFTEVSRIVGISYEADGRPVVPGPTEVVVSEVREILVAANQSRELKAERDALRRERDALQAWKDRAIDELRRCEAWFVKRGASYEEHADKAADEEIRTLWQQSVAVNRESICKVDSMRGALCCKDGDKAAAAAKGVG